MQYNNNDRRMKYVYPTNATNNEKHKIRRQARKLEKQRDQNDINSHIQSLYIDLTEDPREFTFVDWTTILEREIEKFSKSNEIRNLVNLDLQEAYDGSPTQFGIQETLELWIEQATVIHEG